MTLDLRKFNSRKIKCPVCRNDKEIAVFSECKECNYRICTVCAEKNAEHKLPCPSLNRCFEDEIDENDPKYETRSFGKFEFKPLSLLNRSMIAAEIKIEKLEKSLKAHSRLRE